MKLSDTSDAPVVATTERAPVPGGSRTPRRPLGEGTRRRFFRPALAGVAVLAAASAILSTGCGGGSDDEARGRRVVPPLPGRIESSPLRERGPKLSSGTRFSRVAAEESGLAAFVPGWGPEAPARLKEYLFLAAEGGLCAGDYDGDGLPDLYVTSPSGGNRLFRNVGGFRFEDVTESTGVADPSIWGTGATFVDIDDDGDLDLFACAYGQPSRLFVNLRIEEPGKPVRFEERAADFGLDFNGATMTAAFADADRDGDLDVYLATTALRPPPGTQFKVRFEKGEDGVEVPVVLEELREYWELLYLPGDRAKQVEAGQRDRFLRNDGGRFIDATAGSGIDGAWFSLSAVWWDFDDDRWPDLYVSNDFTGPDRLYRNRGDGTFEEVSHERLPSTPWFSMGGETADLDNDGRFDFVATDMAATSHYRDKMSMGNMDDSGWFLDWAEPRQYMRNAVYLNTGTPRFLEAARLLGLASTDWTWSPRCEDFDEDGRVDAFFTNGAPRDTMHSDVTAWAEENLEPGSAQWTEFWLRQDPRPERNLAFRNTGDLAFEPAGKAWGLDWEGITFGVATADFDGDGDLDLATREHEAPTVVMRNDTAETSRIVVALEGRFSNRMGLGARVEVRTAEGSQVRALTLARSWLSSSQPILHFGLGSAERVESLRVSWPSGREQLFEDLPVNHRFLVVESSLPEDAPAAPSEEDEQEGEDATWFARAEAPPDARHVENDFDDFALQPLLPNRLSRLGPGVAVADLDGDGREELWLGGARGQAGRVLRRGDAADEAAPLAGETPEALASDAGREDLGGVFLDADGDGDRDLYVVSGGFEFAANDRELGDRLYLNDGAGGFTPAPEGSVPEAFDSGSVAAAADFDRDGDLDLFVGGRLVPGSFPQTPRSRLWRNRGDGTFEEAGDDELATSGMVTSALWSDVDGDGWVDLLVTTEWGPVRWFRNTEGTLEDRTWDAGLSETHGWWNGIAGADLDADGDIDYVVTNFGLNTKYHAAPGKPELLFFGDFDDSGTPRLVEAKFEGDRCVPRRGFSCSSAAMPFLRDKLKTFHNFASATLPELYTPNRLELAQRLEAHALETSVIVNEGEGRLSFRPLARQAQVAPSFGPVITELDGDGRPDLFLAQNFFGPQRETGRMNGGLGLLLKGDGEGSFVPIEPARSGVVIPGDARAVAATDLDDDGRPDLVVTINDGAPHLLMNRAGDQERFLSVRLRGKAGNPDAVGARVTITGPGILPQTGEVAAGGGYLSQSSPSLWFGLGEGACETIRIRWPDGSESTFDDGPFRGTVTLECP